jgi:hypothetical protein
MPTFIDLSARTTIVETGTTGTTVLTRFLAARTRFRFDSHVDASQIMGDKLLEIDVTTGVKPTDTPDDMAKRLQVQAKYIFPTNGG